MRHTIEDVPKTPFGVSCAVFRENLTLFERCFALVETLSHLDRLALEDRAEHVEDRIVTYRAT